MEDYYPGLYFGAIHALVAIALFCSLLLWTQRSDGERSRRFLAWTWFFLLFLYVARLFKIYKGILEFEEVLPINSASFGAALVALMTIYPIEVVRPRWLNKKRILLLLSPVILVFAVQAMIALWGGGFRVLGSMSDIARYWYEPNVWIRFLIVLLAYGYAFILFYIPYNKMRNNTTLDWIRAYTLGNFAIGFLYLGLMLYGIYPIGIVHTLYVCLYVGYITYQELYIRLFIPESENAQYAARRSKNALLKPKEDRQLWDKMEEYMRKEPVWHDPNFSIQMLADAVGATCTEIAAQLEVMGYGKFDDYTGEFRVREFCTFVRNRDVITIEDAFFRVGFRYRDIATKQFQRVMKQSPEEYIRRN